MLTDREFVTMSIDLNLFFLRIMKEHSLFLQLGFMPRDSALGAEAASLRMGFEELLGDAVELANGAVSSAALQSQQITTQYTMEAERLTRFYTGLTIDSTITREEAMLTPSQGRFRTGLANEVERLDRDAYRLTGALARFKEKLLANIRACKLFTVNYPLLIDHILREARLFMQLLAALVRGENIMAAEELINQEAFWNRIMAEHSKFIAGLLDPTEEELIDTARNFGKEFDMLTAEAIAATDQAINIQKVTDDSMSETMKLRDFKAAGTKGILECKIQSIIIPLLGDHVLREANHFLFVMSTYGRGV
jgi:hypothetical protein